MPLARVRALPEQCFAAFVGVYPNCGVNLRDDAQLLPALVRIHHGDLMTSPDFCREWAARARSAGADIELRSPPGAGHGMT